MKKLVSLLASRSNPVIIELTGEYTDDNRAVGSLHVTVDKITPEKGTPVIYEFTVGNAPVKILEANPDRITATIYNDEDQKAYARPDDAFDNLPGIPLPGNSFAVDDDTCGEWWAGVRAPNAETTIIVVEVTR